MFKRMLVIMGVLCTMPACNAQAKSLLNGSHEPTTLRSNTSVEILGEVDFPGQGSRQLWQRAGALQDQAVLLSMEGRFDEAIEKAKAAISIYPYDYCFHNTLAIAFHHRNQPGDLEMSQQSFETSLGLRTDDPMVWDNLARVYEEQNNLVKAKQAWLRCIALKPSKKKLEEVNEAIRRCDNALTMNR